MSKSGSERKQIEREPILKRFWSKVDETDGCWNYLSRSARPQFSIGYYGGVQMILAHRFSWGLAYGYIPDANVYLACGNLKCVNPDHMKIKVLSIKPSRCLPSPELYEGEVWLMKKLYESGKFEKWLIGAMFRIYARSTYNCIGTERTYWRG